MENPNLSDLKLIITDFVNNTTLLSETNLNDINSFISEVIISYNGLYNTDYDSHEGILYNNVIQLINNIREEHFKHYNIDSLKTKIDALKCIKQPEQRSKEWYEYRSNRLTASDLATALNKNPYSDRKKLIAKKCGYNEPFNAGKAVIHGIKFEPVAIYMYEKRFNVSVYEYGCLPHPTIEYFGASPDGIVDPCSENKLRVGRMLEIKCPKSRKITGIVPEYYELQIQGQLEVCDLEYCDYLECAIKEYETMEAFLEDSHENNFNRTKDNMERGMIIEYYNTLNNKTNYLYNYDIQSLQEALEWRDAEIEKIVLSDGLEYIQTSFWKLVTFSIVLVKRDKERFNTILLPEITRFWNDVLHYRTIGYESLIKQKKVYNTEPKNTLTFLPED